MIESVQWDCLSRVEDRLAMTAVLVGQVTAREELLDMFQGWKAGSIFLQPHYNLSINKHNKSLSLPLLTFNCKNI